MMRTVTETYYDPPALPFAKQKSDNRARTGLVVGAALDHAPGFWRLSSDHARPVQLYIRDGFLSGEECAGLVAQIDAGCFPSPLYDKQSHEGARTSSSCNLNVYDPLVAAVETRIAKTLGIERSWGEPLQGQRYEVGQEFRPHSDFFYIDQPYWPDYEPHGGQRTWTVMIYLAGPDAGGATAFPLLGAAVRPAPGRLLAWNNMAADGSPNGWTLHAGEPVTAGTKYIVTKWYRERPFV